jgi:undecaprenyl diphosphate synthase
LNQGGLHVAIIMDGNGRWATARGLPRAAGHQAGAEAVRRVVEAAANLGITTLTLFAFSADNWRRPETEVRTLLVLLEEYLRSEASRLTEQGCRLKIIGRRDRLPLALRVAVSRAERTTAGGKRLDLRIAIDYSARDAILAAATRLRGREPCGREHFARVLAAASNAPRTAPDVDLLIRTGGERRLSDFLLWECAYAELHFTDRAWPDFGAADLESALSDFRGRTRKFGGLTPVGS